MQTLSAPSIRILVLNPGSATFKFGLYEYTNLEVGCRIVSSTVPLNQTMTVREAVRTTLADPRVQAVDVVAYRVVHGGTDLILPTKVTSSVLETLSSLTHLSPLHQKPVLEAMRSAFAIAPNALHIACFDTAFHATMPIEEKLLALPREMFESGIRRFGFHGSSYESIASQLPVLSPRAANGRTVVCHLGNGASLCGMVAGQSRVTTMGFTPLDGLIMGTRVGRIDPGVILHLLRTGLCTEEVEQILTRKSGLLGISAKSSDMQELIQLSPTHLESRQAVDLFCNCVSKEIASAATSLGGLDALVFTAGIGENSPFVRSAIVKQLAWIGGRLDDSRNQANATQLHSEESAFEILRVATDEQGTIAKHARTMYQNLYDSKQEKPHDH